MSLARAEGPFQGAAKVTAVSGSALVIAVAPNAEERLRLAQLVGDHATVVLVGTRSEAIAMLLGGPPAPQPDGSMFGTPTHVPPSPPPPALTIDSDLRTAAWNGRSVPLSPLEHDLLRCLLTDVGHTFAFADLHTHVWGNAHLGDRSDVQSVVKRLRPKLRDLDCPLEIMAVRGVGLRLVDRSPLPDAPVGDL